MAAVNADARKFLSEAARLGWRLDGRTNKNHMRMRNEKTDDIVIVAAKLSCDRAARNALSTLRRPQCGMQRRRQAGGASDQREATPC